MKSINFFGDLADLEHLGLGLGGIRFFTGGTSDLGPREVAWQEIIRKGTSGPSALDPFYLASQREPSAERVAATGKLVVDLSMNPDAISISIGGRMGQDALVVGRMGILETSEVNQNLFKQFKKAMKAAGFVAVRGHLVGPKALAFLRQGGRLVFDITAPDVYDLRE